MAVYKNITVTKEFLNNEPNAYFVFGDNILHVGTGGAAAMRGHPRTIGFVTKKEPNNKKSSFYKPGEYTKVFFKQLKQLKKLISSNPTKTFYISKLGAGLANANRIWELVIRHNLVEELKSCDNVVFCWEEDPADQYNAPVV